MFVGGVGSLSFCHLSKDQQLYLHSSVEPGNCETGWAHNVRVARYARRKAMFLYMSG